MHRVGAILDSRSALGIEQEDGRLGGVVYCDRDKQFVLDLDRPFHEHFAHGEVAEPHLEQLGGLVVGLVRGVGELDTALGSPTGDPRLHLEHDPPAQLIGHGAGLVGGRDGLPRRGRETAITQQRLGLIFVQPSPGPHPCESPALA